MPNLCNTKKSQQTCTKLQNKVFRTREKNFNHGAFKMDDLKEEEKISSMIELSISMLYKFFHLRIFVKTILIYLQKFSLRAERFCAPFKTLKMCLMF